MRAMTSIRYMVLTAIGVLFAVGIVGLGVHHPVSTERARSLGPPAAGPAQVGGNKVTAPPAAVPPAGSGPEITPASPTAPPASPAEAGASSGGSGLQARGAGLVASGSAPIPNTGAPSMLVPGCLLLALALAAGWLATKAAA